MRGLKPLTLEPLEVATTSSLPARAGQRLPKLYQAGTGGPQLVADGPRLWTSEEVLRQDPAAEGGLKRGTSCLAQEHPGLLRCLW